MSAITRLVSRLPKGAHARFMSGGSHAEHVEVMEKWRVITYVGLPVVAAFGTFVMYRHFAHHHEHHDKIAYPHLKIRSKPFPWGSKDCDLFDFACKKAAYEEANA